MKGRQTKIVIELIYYERETSLEIIKGLVLLNKREGELRKA